LTAGSVVLPASGLPVIALADRPATAKSPVIAVVRDEDIDLIGQARPGQMVHLLG
jgi:allophanate hydrolase subunit 2